MRGRGAHLRLAVSQAFTGYQPVLPGFEKASALRIGRATESSSGGQVPGKTLARQPSVRARDPARIKKF